MRIGIVPAKTGTAGEKHRGFPPAATQKLDAWALVGMGLIVSGVAVLSLLSKTSAH